MSSLFVMIVLVGTGLTVRCVPTMRNGLGIQRIERETRSYTDVLVQRVGHHP